MGRENYPRGKSILCRVRYMCFVHIYTCIYIILFIYSHNNRKTQWIHPTTKLKYRVPPCMIMMYYIIIIHYMFLFLQIFLMDGNYSKMMMMYLCMLSKLCVQMSFINVHSVSTLIGCSKP